jgi:hypothetical protein
MNSVWRTLAWLVMVLLSLFVAGYASALLLGAARSPFVEALLAERPLAAYAHFSGCALALAFGGFQLHPSLRGRWPAVHRWMGRLYLLGVALGGTAGLFMAFFAHGGIVGKLGFASLACAWLGTSWLGYARIRAGRVMEHKSWMIRSFALAFAAVTLRLYIPASHAAGISFDAAYPAIAWLAWVPNLLVAELFVPLRARLRVLAGS